MSAIELYEKLFYVFAGMGVLSLALSVFLFFRFDIPQTYAMLTGKARRKTIQEIESRNAQTGRLRQNPRGSSGNLSKHATSQRRAAGQSRPMEKRSSTGRAHQSGRGQRERRPNPAAARPNPSHRPAPAERLETEVLSAPAMQTVMLSKPTGVTEDLARTEKLKPVPDTSFYFQVTENTICIHTDELI